MTDTYVGALVYKGPEQTEAVPANGVRFPDNIVFDLSHLISDRTMSEYPVIDHGVYGRFDKYANYRAWCDLAPHVEYCYYGSANVCQTYARMHKELVEAHYGHAYGANCDCTGGGHAFEDFTPALFLRMAYDLAADPRALMERMIRIKFGPAAPHMMRYADETYASFRKRHASGPFLLSYASTLQGQYFDTEDFVRWQRLFDEAERAVGGREPYAKHLAWARSDVDVWTIMFARRIRKVAPDFSFDVNELDRRARAAEKSQSEGRRLKIGHRQVSSALDDFANFATLKSDELPSELADCPKDKVTLFLPPKRKPNPIYRKGFWSEPDPVAASGWASGDTVDDLDYSKGVNVLLFDETKDKRLIQGVDMPLSRLKKGAYTLFRVGTSRVSGKCRVVIGQSWGSSLDTSQLSRLYDPTYEHRQYEIWVSLRAEGPKFFPGDKGPSRLYWDRIYTIDRGMKEGN